MSLQGTRELCLHPLMPHRQTSRCTKEMIIISKQMMKSCRLLAMAVGWIVHEGQSKAPALARTARATLCGARATGAGHEGRARVREGG